MRNIFDQYSQPENRLTHSLASVLHHDNALLKHFLQEFVPKADPPAGHLRIIEQGLPGKTELDEGEAIRQGLPDALIFSVNGWALVIESKIAAPLTIDQLNRHLHTVRKCGYDRVSGITITVEKPSFILPDWHAVTWRDIYSWGNRHKDASPWARLLVEYFNIAEAKMAQTDYLTEGTITEFSGISFDQYEDSEAKRILKLLTQKLRNNHDFVREMGIDDSDQGRKRITIQDVLWDVLYLKEKNGHQEIPHFTIGIGAQTAEVMITFPNRIDDSLRARLKSS